MNIAKLTKGTIAVKTEYKYTDEDGKELTEVINSVVRRGSVSLKINDDLMSTDGGRTAKALSEIIESWDIDVEGTPYPPTAENIYLIHEPLLLKIGRDVVNAVNGNPTKAKP